MFIVYEDKKQRVLDKYPGCWQSDTTDLSLIFDGLNVTAYNDGIFHIFNAWCIDHECSSNYHFAKDWIKRT